MTFEQQKQAFMVAWVLTVIICGVIVSIASGPGWILLAGLALIPPVVAFRLWAPRPQTLSDGITKARRRA